MAESETDAHSRSEQQQLNRLVASAVAGDRDAYRHIYETHVNRVYALCYRLTGDTSLAEDATQEVFIQVWRKLGNYQGQSLFSTWLHSVTANVTISYLRKQKSWMRRLFNTAEQIDNEAGAASCSSEVDLERYIRQLPERARVVFVLHAIEGYRHDDIAVMLNIAQGTSKAQFHRARQLLEAWMGESDV